MESPGGDVLTVDQAFSLEIRAVRRNAIPHRALRIHAAPNGEPATP